MTGSEILAAFELYTDDSTELSPTEELALANRKYRLILGERPWEFLRKEQSTTVASSAVALPSDFDAFMHNYTDDPTMDVPDTPVVYIGTEMSPYFLVNMGMRYGLTKQSNWCWYNPTTGNIKFQTAPDNGKAAVFDYKYRPDDITTGTSPVIPTDYQIAIVFAMLIDDEIIQKSEKARSNRLEYQVAFNETMSQLRMRDARYTLP